MARPLVTLPIVERWDCHHCGICCRGTIVPLSGDDLRKLRAQRWDEHPELGSTPIIVTHGLFRKSHELAKHHDGSCVFLTSEGLCRIHAEHGPMAKPLVCQMFPLQLVPLEKSAVLTVRRACPSAAAEQGRTLDEHVADVRNLARQTDVLDQPVRPPEIVRGVRRPWNETLWVLRHLEQLVSDSRYPVVRRLVHGLNYCNLLDQCRLQRLDGAAFAELLTVLQTSAVQEARDVFRDRVTPSRAAGTLFRQAAAEHVRLHPTFVARGTWRERWQLIHAAVLFARGTGPVPPIHPGLPKTDFESLERPLGVLEAAIYQPLVRFYETIVASHQYAIAQRIGWPVVDQFRALAFSYGVALWLLRWMVTDRAPSVEDMISVVVIVDRAQGYAPLATRRHRSRITTLARIGELDRLLAWYAR